MESQIHHHKLIAELAIAFNRYWLCPVYLRMGLAFRVSCLRMLSCIFALFYRLCLCLFINPNINQIFSQKNALLKKNASIGRAYIVYRYSSFIAKFGLNRSSTNQKIAEAGSANDSTRTR